MKQVKQLWPKDHGCFTLIPTLKNREQERWQKKLTILLLNYLIMMRDLIIGTLNAVLEMPIAAIAYVGRNSVRSIGQNLSFTSLLN